MFTYFTKFDFCFILEKKKRSNSTINGLEANIDQVEFGMTTRFVQFQKNKTLKSVNLCVRVNSQYSNKHKKFSTISLCKIK